MTYQSLLENAANSLNKAHIPDAQTDAWRLFEATCGLSLAEYLTKQAEEATTEEEQKYQTFIEERITGKPVQLILGEADFMGFTFKVDGNELIPRQDTEILVEKVLELKKTYEKSAFPELYAELQKPVSKYGRRPEPIPANLKLLDLFTGTGCIATSLALLGNFEKVEAGDISEKAIANAKTNAQLIFTEQQEKRDADAIANVPTQPTFKLGDMFEPFEGEIFDIITANPPYIRSKEIAELMPEVRDYDPHLALDGGADGLIFYRRLAVAARAHLSEGGAIFMEIGYDQARDVSSIFAEMRYKDITVIKDYSGNDRVVIARK